MHHPTDRITHTTAFVTPVRAEREIAIALTTELHLAPAVKRSYIYTIKHYLNELTGSVPVLGGPGHR